jgi:molybdopterin converting factor subunit 1
MPNELITIHIQYFAVLREQRGASAETVRTSARTAKELYDELAARHHMQLDPGLVRASVNLEFRQMDTVLKDGDHIVFIPPVAGG